MANAIGPSCCTAELDAISELRGMHMQFRVGCLACLHLRTLAASMHRQLKQPPAVCYEELVVRSAEAEPLTVPSTTMYLHYNALPNLAATRCNTRRHAHIPQPHSNTDGASRCVAVID